ncbi:MAG: LamG domain-containing protein [Candidatus Marsarchaeota archaeon]|nr:LamG domain-containing protein [Candidatus Marsarchaeota archaeon]
MKAQSAMEYLMTYGWAILVIAIVLAALYGLGVFNPLTFAAKASPGSCTVVRPDGPRTLNFISLSGLCNEEIPKFVMATGPNQYDYALVSDTKFNSSFAKAGAITLSAWVYEEPNSECEVSVANMYPVSGSGSAVFRFGVGGGSWGNGVLFELWSGSTGVQTNFLEGSVPYDKWVNIAATYNGNYVDLYLDGQEVSSISYNAIMAEGQSSSLVIGANPNSGCASYLPGYLSNLQIYDAALSQNDIMAMYQGGINSNPINLPKLVGWWPLDSNLNDYSGNGYDGTPSSAGVSYSGSWYTTYSTP